MSNRFKSFRRAALLLEVIVALTIMVAAMGVLGAQMTSGLRMTTDADQRTRAAALADRLLALVELDPRMQELILVEEQTDGDFGEQYPGWFWELTLEPLPEVAGLGLVRVALLYQENPELRDGNSSDGATLYHQVALLKAAPGRIDLVKDFGMDEEAVAELEMMMPVADFDGGNVDVQALVAFATQDPEALLQLLPELMPLLQMFGGNLGGVAGGGPLGPGGLASQLRGQLGGPAGELGELGELAELGEGAPGGPDVEELLRLGDELSGGGARPGGEAGVRPGAAPGERGPGRAVGPTRRGGARGNQGLGPRRGRGAGQRGDQPRYTIEDLLRMRDEMQGRGGR